MEVIQELPIDQHRLCLTQDGRRVFLELWLKTKRRKSPWDRLLVATMEDGAGLLMIEAVNIRAEPFLDRIRGLVPKFDSLAIVESVNLR